tara:strand:- start:161 stop:310 length:150 start_codon:yes stop_codon:yes gene_type:complete
MCGVIATECKTEGCSNMARYDIFCFRCAYDNDAHKHYLRDEPLTNGEEE